MTETTGWRRLSAQSPNIKLDRQITNNNVNLSYSMVSDKWDIYEMNLEKVVQTLQRISCERHGSMTIIGQDELFHQPRYHNEVEVEVLRPLSIKM